MAFRDDGEAARARADALEQEVRQLRAELARAQAPRPDPIPDLADLATKTALVRVEGKDVVPANIVPDPPWKFRADTGLLGLGMLVGSCGLWLGGIVPWLGLTVGGAGALLCAAGWWLTAVRPGFALVLTGRTYPLEQGRTSWYRLVSSGNALQRPGERLHWLNLSPFFVAAHVKDAPTDAGQLVQITARCELRVGPDEAAQHRTISYFLETDDPARMLPDGKLEVEVRRVVERRVREQAASSGALLDAPQFFAEGVLAACADELRKLGLLLDALTVVSIEQTDSGEG